MSEENLKLYNELRVVPDEAQTVITGGRLKGFTDINPMWRIKKLTEIFGVCGIGWYYDVVQRWMEKCDATGEVVGFTDINLFIKDPNTGEWSKPIAGSGGATFIAIEKKGLYVSDEVYKMATTDAISVAAKQLGIGADVYFMKDANKCNNTPSNPPSQPEANIPAKEEITQAIEEVSRCTTTAQLVSHWKTHGHLKNITEYKNKVSEMGGKLKGV